MNSLPPFDGPAWMFSNSGWSASVALAGCVVCSNLVIAGHAASTSSIATARPTRKVLPPARSQRSLAKNPPPTSYSPPVSSCDSWTSRATSGETRSGLSA